MTVKRRDMQQKRASTASHRHIPTDDYALTQEALRIASTQLRYEARRLARMWPASPLVERIRVFAEQMDDLHARNGKAQLRTA